MSKGSCWPTLFTRVIAPVIGFILFGNVFKYCGMLCHVSKKYCQFIWKNRYEMSQCSKIFIEIHSVEAYVDHRVIRKVTAIVIWHSSLLNVFFFGLTILYQSVAFLCSIHFRSYQALNVPQILHTSYLVVTGAKQAFLWTVIYKFSSYATYRGLSFSI